jgi:predicted alternative tryptophan synthase beta-subunit
VLSQTVNVTTTADGLAVSGSIKLPAYSNILRYSVDQIVDEVVGGGTMTTIPVTVGTAAAGAQYMTSTDMVGGGRANATLTTAQLLAMANIGTNISVFLTVDPNGTIVTTQGVYRLTVEYTQPA